MLWALCPAHETWDIPQAPAPVPSGCEPSPAHRSGDLYRCRILPVAFCNSPSPSLQFILSVQGAVAGALGCGSQSNMALRPTANQAQGSQTLTCLMSTSVQPGASAMGERASKKATGRNCITRNHSPTLCSLNCSLLKARIYPFRQRALPKVLLGGKYIARGQELLYDAQTQSPLSCSLWEFHWQPLFLMRWKLMLLTVRLPDSK